MTIKAILWTYEKSHNGMADIKIYTYPPKKYHSTGIKVYPKDWDKKKGCVKKTNVGSTVLNAKIQRLVNEHTIRLHENRVGDGSLISFLKVFIEEAEKGLHPIKISTLKKYEATLNRLNQYCKLNKIEDVQLNDCTLQWYSTFCIWLVDYANCNSPGVLKHTKILKRVLRLAHERKLHDNEDYKRFRANRRTIDKIYLRPNELESLYALNISAFPYLALERDRFMVSYYLILRFGDSVNIRRENAYQEGDRWFYRYRSEKTNTPVTIPIKQRALEILNRNNWDFSNCINQTSNRYLKQIAALAGITEVAKEGDKVAAKSQFVTTHTARRSAVTNMALDGVNIATIAKLGGWEQMKTLKHYLRASGIDVARAAADLDFFK